MGGLFGGLGDLVHGAIGSSPSTCGGTCPQKDTHGPLYIAARTHVTLVLWGVYSTSTWVRFDVFPVSVPSTVRVVDQWASLEADGVGRRFVTIENPNSTAAMFLLTSYRG